MKVQLRLFAVAREIAKCDALDLDLPAGATIGKHWSRNCRDWPEFRVT